MISLLAKTNISIQFYCTFTSLHRPIPWAILDPMTGRPVEEEPRRAYNNRQVQARKRY